MANLTAVRRHFLVGIVVIAPLVVTILVLVWVFTFIDGILQPVMHQATGRTIPGLGFAVMVLLIYGAGFTASTVLGRRFIRWGESLLGRVPVVRAIYAGTKQVVDGFSGSRSPGKTGFQRVVFVEFPRKGMWSLAFVTSSSLSADGCRLLCVYVPGSPNPTSGFLQIVAEDEVMPSGVSIDDALKMVVSVGNVVPPNVAASIPPPGPTGTPGT